MSLVKERFIAVAADDWYQRRRNDPVGRYFRYLVGQSESQLRRETYQGIYVFTARGRLLSYKNRGRSAETTLSQLLGALDQWDRLPASHTRPGAFVLPAMSNDVWDQRHSPSPPANTLVLNVFTRALERDTANRLQRCAIESGSPVGKNTALDHAWLREAEWREMIDRAGSSARFELPREISTRLARFHLVDNTRGEPDHWKANEIHELVLNAETVARDDARLVLRLGGTFALATSSDLSQAARGYVGDLIGQLTFEFETERISEFRLAAIGDHWGESRYTPGARAGRTPLGILLARTDEGAAGLVPPQALRSPDRYFGAR